MLKPIALYGAGELEREVLLLIQQTCRVVPQWHMVGFYADGQLQGTKSFQPGVTLVGIPARDRLAP